MATMRAWFLSWFGGEPIDAAPLAPAVYVAGPLTVERDGAGYRVVQQCGKNGRGEPMARSWSFANAEEMKKQLAEFGGAATAPELLAELQLTAPDALEPIAGDVPVVGL